MKKKILPEGLVWYHSNYFYSRCGVAMNIKHVENYDKPGEWYLIKTSHGDAYFVERALLRELTPEEKILYGK